jgi:predicted transcriptional regulator
MGGGKLKTKEGKNWSSKSESRGRRGRNSNSKIGLELELLQRHVNMLRTITENEPIGIIRLAEMLEYPQHKVRYSLRILEQEGLIEPSTDGAVSTKKLKDFLENFERILDEMSKSIINMKKYLK